jgi:hypothetical protein
MGAHVFQSNPRIKPRFDKPNSCRRTGVAPVSRAFLQITWRFMRLGRTLPGPDQSARGLAQSKTLARMALAFVNAKRLGLRWPSTAFPQRRVSPISFRKKSLYDLWKRSDFNFLAWNESFFHRHRAHSKVNPLFKMETGATPVLRWQPR